MEIHQARLFGAGARGRGRGLTSDAAIAFGPDSRLVTRMAPSDIIENPEETEDIDPASDEALTTAPPGSAAGSPWHFPGTAWLQILKRVWIMVGFHNLSLLAGGVAFFTFLAITPLIAATVMIFGLIGDVTMVERQMDLISEVLPGDTVTLLEDQLIGAVTANAGVTGLALAIALFFAVFGSMRAANGLVSALNVINDERETRSIFMVYRRAAALTLAAIGIAIIGLSSGGLFAWLQLASADILGPVAEFAVKVLTWLLAVVLASFGFAVVMRFGPDRTSAQWRWLTPGALLSTVLFIAISFGFSLYVAYISDYNAMYGSLSAIVVFLMWLFLSAYCVLVGALINAEAERQTFRDSTVGPEKPIGERDAVLADSTLLEGHGRHLKEKARRHRARRIARKVAKDMAAKE